MTAFTPQIRVMTLPPNTDHSATKTEITSWVDYTINVSRGTSEFIDPPYPGTCTLSLLFDENLIPDIAIGSWVEIQVKDSTNTWIILHAGNVTNRTSSYRSYGLAGFILQWDFDLTSPISLLQNTSYSMDFDTSGVADDLINAIIIPQAVAFNWTQLSNNLTWAAYGPGTWAQVDASRETDFPTISFDVTSTIDQELQAGTRNAWDDMTKLYYGIYGYVIESPDGSLSFYETDTELTQSLTFSQDMLDPSLIGNERVDKMRNVITLTKADGTSKTYYNNDSISLYGERIGSIDTAVVLTADINAIASKMLNGLSYPLLSTEQISVNLLNPVFINADRDLLLSEPLGQRVTVEAPTPMGNTLDYLTIGVNYTINKDQFIVDLNLVPYSTVLVSPNWEQIPYNYTWTSYGVAFPTQEWIDL
jgi:hypothetical protein